MSDLQQHCDFHTYLFIPQTHLKRFQKLQIPEPKPEILTQWPLGGAWGVCALHHLRWGL